MFLKGKWFIKFLKWECCKSQRNTNPYKYDHMGNLLADSADVTDEMAVRLWLAVTD